MRTVRNLCHGHPGIVEGRAAELAHWFSGQLTAVTGNSLASLVSQLTSRADSAEFEWLDHLDETELIRYEWRAWSSVGAFLFRDETRDGRAWVHVLAARGVDRIEWVPRSWQANQARYVWDPRGQRDGSKIALQFGAGDEQIALTCWGFQYAKVVIASRTPSIPAYDALDGPALSEVQPQWEDRVVRVLECSIPVSIQ